MNKPRKYNGVYKLPIKKHTKVRRPMSRWKILLNIGTPVLFRIGISVNDISIGLENPLDLSGSDLKFVDDYAYEFETNFIDTKEVKSIIGGK